jgi:hypothetical protein
MRELLRVTAGVIALALLGYPFTLTGLSRGYLALAVPVGLLVLSGLLLWSETALTVAAAALVFPYAVAIAVEERPVDLLAPVGAALLLVFVHVADTAIATPPRTPVDAVFLRRLALDCARLSATALAVGAVVLAASALPVPDSQPLRALGLAAAAVALVVPVHLLSTQRAQRAARRRLGRGFTPARTLGRPRPTNRT